MKCIKIAVLGAALVALAPSAFADQLYGSISLSGTATISTTSFSFPQSNPNEFTGNQVNVVSNPYYDQANGAVFASSGSFSTYTSAAAAHYVTGATSTTTTGTGASARWTGRSLAKLLFPTTLGVAYATPLEFIEVRQASKVLDIFLTQINTRTVGVNKTTHTPGVTGDFTGLGYVTDDGGLTKTYGTFTLTDSGVGAGKQPFSSTFTSVNPMAAAPEPSSLALLGTGAMGAAGMMFRKRRAV